ncbi:MAG: carboxy-S-adenosyl-L-methionine synthase CmoA [Granulosicoccaceae bacterium]
MPDSKPPHDNLYAQPLGHVPDFSFDNAVVEVFDDMINRSVPGYASIVSLTGHLAARHAQNDTRLYELGCSTGASLFSMRRHVEASGCTLVGIDNSTAMIDACRRNLAKAGGSAAVELHRQDLFDAEIQNASVVVLNFTLQFVPMAERDDIIRRIYTGLNPGGILVLSEKICFDDTRQQVLHTDMHHAFKRQQGYSDLEIAQKRSAIEHVMQPETLDTHKQRLRAAGFDNAEVWFQCFNFLSLVALR